MSGGSAQRVLPDWWGPPDGWIGGALPFDLVVARSEVGAILAEDIVVYPTGIGFELRALLRPKREIVPQPTIGATEPSPDATEARRLSAGFGLADAPSDYERVEMPADRVRFGVEFEDGRRAERTAPVGGPGNFTILAFQEGKPVHPDPATNIVLNWSSGSSSPDSMNQSSYLWPLPRGEFRLFGSWVDAGLAEQDVVIERTAIKDALDRARPGWRD